MGHDIYRATEFDLLPLNPNVSAHNPPHAVEAHLLALVRSHFYGGNFLFSYTWDLTRRLQAQSEKHENEAGKSLWEVVSSVRWPLYQSLTTFRPTIAFFGIGVFICQNLILNLHRSTWNRFIQTRLIDLGTSDRNKDVRRPFSQCSHSQSPLAVWLIYPSYFVWK